ncbi:AMP-binding protein [Kitasatospora sp. NPDC052868]|uniref:AMP-binding protein n=1 Tax=Kitasatospora sp. NPDC052868 TaxID=3364060 RepID=UPI0037C8D634
MAHGFTAPLRSGPRRRPGRDPRSRPPPSQATTGVVISAQSTPSGSPSTPRSPRSNPSTAPHAPGPLTLPDLLDHRAALHPDRVALLTAGGGGLSYGRWRERAVRAAHALAGAGVRPGDRIALLFTNREWEEYAVAFLAAHYAGAAALVVREDLSTADTVRLVQAAGARWAIAGEGRATAPAFTPDLGRPSEPAFTPDRLLALDRLEAEGSADSEPPHRPSPGDLAQVIGTSGTTGAPKGVRAAHASLTAGLVRDPRPRPYAHSRYAVHAFPIGTNAAQVVLVNALTAQPATICLPRFEAAEFGRVVEEYRAGTVFLVPSMAVELLNSRIAEQRDLTSVLLVSCSAAALPGAVAAGLATALPKATLVNTYTSAEASPAQISAIVDTRRPGSVGRPADPGDLRILGADGAPVETGGTGEIWLRQPGPARGYVGDEERGGAVFRDGWVRMGDLGRLDQDGYLHLVDREGDLIKSGALKVSTLRIEEVLHEHPQVADAAALGVPHPVMGSVPVAAVVPAADGLDLDALRLFLSARLARPELPVRILVTDDLPRNPSGKVVKHELRARFEQDQAPAADGGTAPATAAELALAALWRKVLGRPVRAVEEEFFALGGDSFRAVQLAAAISAEFGVAAGTALVFERPSLRAQAAWVALTRTGSGERTGSTGRDEPADRAADGSTGGSAGGSADGSAEVSPFLRALRAQPHELPLTSQQENFLRWTAEAPGRSVGSVVAVFRVTEELRTDVLSRALLEAVRRNPALRTRFVPVDGTEPGVVRTVLDEQPRADVLLVDAPGEDDARVSARLIAERDRLTDLARDPMTRLVVVSRGPAEHVVLLAVHHIVADGWSVGVLLRELGVLYSALRRGRPAPAPRPGPAYRELVEWSNGHWTDSREHFARALAGAPEAVDPFPGRGEVETVLSEAHRFTVSAERAQALRARAAELGATPFLAVAALWTGLLAAHSGQSDLVLMTPVPGRTRPEAERAVGCFVQSLLVRVDAGGSPGFAELLDRVRVASTAALDHQLYPFAEFSPRVPFAAWLRYESWSAPAQLPGVVCEEWELPRNTTVPWPIPGGDRHVPELMVAEQPDGSLRCWLRYNGHAFAPEAVAGLAARFTAALDVAAPDAAAPDVVAPDVVAGSLEVSAPA